MLDVMCRRARAPTRVIPSVLAGVILLIGAVDPTLARQDEASEKSVSILGVEWRKDSDGNGIPDFIEIEIGADPTVDDCPTTACGPGAPAGEFFRKPRNTLIMLDSSGSMSARMGGSTKLDVARDAIKRYASLAGLMQERLGLLVYGHKGSNKEAGKPESCTGVDVLARIGDVDADAFTQLLAGFRPVGWTPIAKALEHAAGAFERREGEASRVILVSDGVETCGGDPVAAARRLNASGLSIAVDVIGFDIKDGREAAALRRIAEAGGGTYVEARNARELNAFFKAQGEAMRQTTEALLCEFRNSSPNQVCVSQLTFRATQRIRRFQTNLSPRSPEHRAYDAVLRDIDAHRAERDRARQEASARVMQLLDRSQKLRDAMARAYGLR